MTVTVWFWSTEKGLKTRIQDRNYTGVCYFYLVQVVTFRRLYNTVTGTIKTNFLCDILNNLLLKYRFIPSAESINVDSEVSVLLMYARLQASQMLIPNIK